jgi:nicotinate-nucleotide--dimethylbenzimidazole phosphoribosyltransferase
MVDNFLRGGAAINVLARHGEFEVRVVDASVDADLSEREELINLKNLRGTANFARGPAMTREEAERLIHAGSKGRFPLNVARHRVGRAGLACLVARRNSRT